MSISEVYNMDCMEGMAKYPDNYFDLAIVDPPYGLDLANMNMGVGKSKKSSKIQNRKWIAKDWDLKTPSEDYFTDLFRLSKNVIIWGGNYFNLGSCKHYIIWDKEIPEGLSFADCEMAWTTFEKSPRIFRYSAYLDKKTKFHPTQKPIKLYKWLLTNYAKQGDKILDTHLGSGSSRIAAYDMGFDFVGFELDKDYFDAQEKRFNDFKQQLKLF
jgi:site-specific DNA-methyltransferase (adenine-specific)